MALVKGKALPAPGTPSPPAGEILSALCNETPEVRRLAALALIGDPGAVTPIADALAVESDRAAREAMATALAATGGRRAAAELARVMRGPDTTVRNAAAEALSCVPEARTVIPSLLSDPDPEVRVMAVGVLGLLRTHDVTGWLREIVHTDDDPNVCGAALAELTEIGADHLVDIDLVAARWPDDPFITFQLGAMRRRLGETA